MSLLDKDALIEQIALLFASFVWTTVILTAIAIFWVYQDVNTRWEFIANTPPEALAQAAATPTPTPISSPTLTPTPWAGPGSTATPTATKPPTTIPTTVITAPEILPETFNLSEPSPVPVIVHTDEEAAEFGLDSPAAPRSIPPTSAPGAASPTAPAGQSSSRVVGDEPQAPAPTRPLVAVGDLIPDRLVIKSVGIDTPVQPVGWQMIEQGGQEYSIWQVADYAVGWHRTTARLGQPGNSVMAGHHNVKGEVFRDLVNVEVGDKVIAYDGDQKFEYVVDLKTIIKEKGEPLEVRRRNAQWIAPTDDERLTFVTCWPYTNNTHRVIVVARPS